MSESCIVITTHPQNPNVRLIDGAFYAGDAHTHFHWMREHAPVYWDEAGQVWGIASYADVMTVSKDPPTFCSGQGMRPDTPSMPYMVNLDDPLHRQRRALVNKGFTVRRVAEREPRLREICVDLIERAQARGRFDFVHDLAAWLPLIVIGDMLGVQPDAYDDLLRWSDDMLSSSGVMIPERLERAQQAFLEYREYQLRVIADRRARPPQDDLVSILVHAEIDGAKLDDDALVMESLLILIGGDETTRHVISGGMHQLFHHPEQRRALAHDPTKIPTAVEEMLRWVSPIQNMARTATRDVVLHGQRLRQGDKLLLLYPSANRDDAVFDQPLTFNIARTPNDHVAFGFGAHYCLGASLARLELRVMFEELLARMPALELATDAPPSMRASNFITGIESLPVEWRG